MTMNKIQLKTRQTRLLADTITPVSIYLKLRDRFANSILLESSDYHGSENSFSYICCSPIASFQVFNNEVSINLPGKAAQQEPLKDFKTQLSGFTGQFQLNGENKAYIKSGLFGYFSYDSIQHFESVELKETEESYPLAAYSVYQFIVALDHFKNECHLIETYVDQQDDQLYNEVFNLIQQSNLPSYSFKTQGEIVSDMTDEEYVEVVKKGIHHCHIGDVFQVVMSRKFQQEYQGDDFQVYRTLRSVNPSPYLFYFDYGSYRIFGSSPEAQIVLKDGKATNYPIAGTFRRTGDDAADAKAAEELLKDPKEDSEHVMLVDLARNDLSRSCSDVAVETYKEIQYYSHVIHLVSKVTGKMKPETNFIDVVGETFPAGTLSGAPKIRAMELIGENEQSPRGYYGGAVGFMDFEGNFNHAIMIRSFLSKDNQLTYRAGAGVVAQSNPESELQEVYNKVGALQHAVKEAEKL